MVEELRRLTGRTESAPRTPQTLKDIGLSLEPAWKTVYPGWGSLDSGGQTVQRTRCQVVIPADPEVRRAAGLSGLIVEGAFVDRGGIWADRLGGRLASGLVLAGAGGLTGGMRLVELVENVQDEVTNRGGSLAFLSYNVVDGKVHLGLLGSLCTAYVMRHNRVVVSYRAEALRRTGGVAVEIPIGLGEAAILLSGRADVLVRGKRENLRDMARIVVEARDGEEAAERVLDRVRKGKRMGIKGKGELKTGSVVVVKFILPEGGISA